MWITSDAGLRGACQTPGASHRHKLETRTWKKPRRPDALQVAIIGCEVHRGSRIKIQKRHHADSDPRRRCRVAKPKLASRCCAAWSRSSSPTGLSGGVPWKKASRSDFFTYLRPPISMDGSCLPRTPDRTQRCTVLTCTLACCATCVSDKIAARKPPIISSTSHSDAECPQGDLAWRRYVNVTSSSHACESDVNFKKKSRGYSGQLTLLLPGPSLRSLQLPRSRGSPVPEIVGT